MISRRQEDGRDHDLQVNLRGEEGEEVEGGRPVVLALVMEVGLHCLHQLSALLERVKAEVLQHLGDAVEGGETELVCVLHPEAGGDEAAHHQGEVTLQPATAAVVRQSLQAVYGNQFDLPSKHLAK